MNAVLSALAAGLLFGVGLSSSSMANPAAIMCFLSVTRPGFGPQLMAVMGAAVAVSALAFRYVPRRGKPVFAPRFEVPNRRDVDRRLVLGAIVFGLGWGLSGYCVGPALAGLGAGVHSAMVYLVGVIAGMAIFQWSSLARGR